MIPSTQTCLTHSEDCLTLLPLLSPKLFLLFVLQAKGNSTEQTGDVSRVSSSHIISLCVPHNAHSKEKMLNKCLLIESKLQFYLPPL